MAQVVLKAVCPGVPDFFMGTELWDFSLVDPDNRRPVDFQRRIDLLAELRERKAGPALISELLSTWKDGRVKLYVTWKTLSLRRAKRSLFTSGAYLPLHGLGPAQKHLCALARHDEKNWLLAIVPRLSVRMIAGAGQTALPETKLPLGKTFWEDTAVLLPAEAPPRWRNVFTGEIVSAATVAHSGGNTQTLPMDRVLAIFPVALFTPDKKVER